LKANGLDAVAADAGCELAPNWNGVVVLVVPGIDELELPNANGFVIDCCPPAEKLNVGPAPEVTFGVDDDPGAESAAGAGLWEFAEPNEKIGPLDGVEEEKENALLAAVPGTANGLLPVWPKLGCTANDGC